MYTHNYMKIFLDTDIDEIRAANETGLIDGVTTNPTLILRREDSRGCCQTTH